MSKGLRHTYVAMAITGTCYVFFVRYALASTKEFSIVNAIEHSKTRWQHFVERGRKNTVITETHLFSVVYELRLKKQRSTEHVIQHSIVRLQHSAPMK